MNKEQKRLLEIDEEISILHQEAIDIMMKVVLPIPTNQRLKDATLACADKAIRIWYQKGLEDRTK